MVEYLSPYLRIVLDENAEDFASQYQRRHPTSPMRIQGRVVGIDNGIWKLVFVLNNIPGIVTTFSCQGDNNFSYSDAYVTMHGPQATRVMIKMLRACPNILTAETIGKMKLPKLSPRSAKKALLSESFFDRVAAQIKARSTPLGWVLRWPYRGHNKVLAEAKKLIKN